MTPREPMPPAGLTGPALPRAHRLTRRAEFQATAKGRRYRTERMTVQGRARDPADAAGLRFGITVTKKVGHATERNRIRRRFRAAAVLAAAEHAARPVDVVLVGRREALAASFSLLVDDVRQALGAVTRPDRPRGRAHPSPPGDRRRGSDG